jgi:hypothetical protein
MRGVRFANRSDNRRIRIIREADGLALPSRLRGENLGCHPDANGEFLLS